MKPIIKKITDINLNVFPTALIIEDRFPDRYARFLFYNSEKLIYSEKFVQEFRKQVSNVEKIVINDEDILLLQKHFYFLPSIFFAKLKNYRFDSSEIKIEFHKGEHLRIWFEGLWYRGIFWKAIIKLIFSEMDKK